MKKKPHRGDGMAFSEMTFNDINSNLLNKEKSYNCRLECRLSTPRIAEKDGRNMAMACRSVCSNNETIDKVFNALRDKYCAACRAKFKASFWKELQGDEDEGPK